MLLYKKIFRGSSLLLFMVVQLNLMAQLNCKTFKLTEGAIEKVCYHKNGLKSTVENWDKNERNGKFTAFDNQGKELCEYYLRKFAGHSSVYVNYHKNGQVSKAEYSSAPDGGIQFWRIIHHFNEAGTQTAYYDLSQPDGHPTIEAPERKSPIRQKDTVTKQVHIKTKDSVMSCASIFTTKFKIVNHTTKKLNLQAKSRANLFIFLKDTVFTIKKNDTIIFKEIFYANMFLPGNELFDMAIIEKSKFQKNKLKIIAEMPLEKTPLKTYTWHIFSTN
jgi:hypothetical protein